MRTPRILWRYILTEVVTYAAIGFIAVAAILVSQNLLRRLDELAAVGFSPVDSLAVLACIFPMLASYTVPVAFLCLRAEPDGPARSRAPPRGGGERADRLSGGGARAGLEA
jgi:hypothetical protein